jgi:predicted nuclease of restriction endonuclease-like (RecB) superfamily
MAAKKKAKGTTPQRSPKVKKSASKPGRAVRSPAVPKSKGNSLPRPTSEIARQSTVVLPTGYVELLEDIKDRIRHAQIRAVVGVSRELIRLYWDIGREIVQRQEREGWGKAVVQRLAADLQREFPGMTGFSPQNIWYMRAFYVAWTEDLAKLQQPVGELDGQNLPQVVGEIPWGHNLQLLAKLKDPRERLWYARKAVQHAWSRVTLVHQIELDLYGREGKAITNFPLTLPAPQSDLAQQTLKDPYVFDFLTLAEEARERDLERGLLEHIRDFMLELGVGFAFVGSQYHLVVDGKDYYIDLLFYHLKLRAFAVIDLKVEEFKPEFAGKMSFYLSAVDDLLRHPDDQSSIGIILCKSRGKVTVEYALRDTHKPIGVSEYRLTDALPQELKPSLPTIEELEAELRTAEPEKGRE